MMPAVQVVKRHFVSEVGCAARGGSRAPQVVAAEGFEIDFCRAGHQLLSLERTGAARGDDGIDERLREVVQFTSGSHGRVAAENALHERGATTRQAHDEDRFFGGEARKCL